MVPGGSESLGKHSKTGQCGTRRWRIVRRITEDRRSQRQINVTDPQNASLVSLVGVWRVWKGDM